MKESITLIVFTLILLMASNNSSFGQTIEQTQALSFGTFAAGDGTIIIGENGSITKTGDVRLYLNDRQRADFKITYKGIWAIINNVTVQRSTTLTRVGGGGNMQLINITQPNVSGYMGWITPTKTFHVGGTLVVKPTTPAGHYYGTYTVTVNY